MPRGGKREGAGRPKGSGKADGMPTQVARVSAEITKAQIDALPSLIAVIDYWEAEIEAAKARGESLRTYEKLTKLIDEVRTLGF